MMYLKSFDDMKKTSIFFMLKPSNAIYGFIISLCMTIMVILLWAIFSPMDEIVKSVVYLRPCETISSIKCISTGEIDEKYFKNDDLVKKGDFLFSLDSSSYKSQLETCKKEQIKNENDIVVYNKLLETIETMKLPDIKRDSDGFIKCSAYLTEYKRYENEIKDIRTKLELEQNKSETLINPQMIHELKLELQQNELAFETWKNNQKIQVIENKKQFELNKNALESRIIELERLIKNSTIYAPISGRILETTKVNKGDYIIAGDEILKIIPQNYEKLKAEVYIEPSYIAQIKIGDTVKIKFSGLPPSRYGMIETKILVMPPDISYVNGEPFFIAEAEIKNPYLFAKNGQRAKLIPGIKAEGRIITERSTVMKMFLKKLDFMN